MSFSTDVISHSTDPVSQVVGRMAEDILKYIHLVRG